MPKRAADHLSRREREIMNAVFALGNRAFAEEIRERLTKPPSHSAVRVMLVRLEKKGFLRHDQEGPRNVYSATTSPVAAKRAALRQYPPDLLRRIPPRHDDGAGPGRVVDQRRPRGAAGRNRPYSQATEAAMMRMVGEMAIVMSASLALSLVVKATVVSAAALTAAFLARRTRASVRHLLLATAFILLLILPVVSDRRATARGERADCRQLVRRFCRRPW